MRPHFLFHRHLLAVSLDGGRDKEALWALVYKGTNPIHEDCTFMTYSPLKAPLPVTITLGVMIQPMNLEAGPKFHYIAHIKGLVELEGPMY